MIDSTQLCSITANLGDVKTTITDPASTSHGRLSEEQRQSAGVVQGLIRVAVGLGASGRPQGRPAARPVHAGLKVDLAEVLVPAPGRGDAQAGRRYCLSVPHFLLSSDTHEPSPYPFLPVAHRFHLDLGTSVPPYPGRLPAQAGHSTPYPGYGRGPSHAGSRRRDSGRYGTAGPTPTKARLPRCSAWTATRKAPAQLQASGHVYPCYMSMEELDALRERQTANKGKRRYDGTWRPEPGRCTRPRIPEGGWRLVQTLKSWRCRWQ